MSDISYYQVSGMTIAFRNNENDSAFIASIVPTGDQYEKKEIIVFIDNKKIKEGLFGGIKPKSAISELRKWGGNPEDMSRLSNFFNEKLNKKETPIEKKKKVNVGLTTQEGLEVGLGYSQQDKY